MEAPELAPLFFAESRSLVARIVKGGKETRAVSVSAMQQHWQWQRCALVLEGTSQLVLSCQSVLSRAAADASPSITMKPSVLG